MAKFVYRLQNILDIKYKLESQAKSEYGAAIAVLRQEKVKLQTIYDDIYKYEEDLRELNLGNLTVLKMQECVLAIEYKKGEAKAQKIVIQRAEARVERLKEKLNEVMKDRKTYERLREKAFEEFLHEISVQESKEIDELVSFKHNNQNTGE